MAARLDVNTSDVQRDYLHGWILAETYRRTSLGQQLALKGGACFRKAYFPTARYSRDLDFTTPFRFSEDELRSELLGVIGAVAERTGVEFDLDRTIVAPKRRADKSKVITEARFFFRDFYGDESQLVLAVRLDLTQLDQVHLPVQERHLIHQYSDSAECTTTIRCVKLEELLALKMRCLLQRRHIADLYDLAFPALFGGALDVDRSEILSTFLRVTIFGHNPNVAKGLLLDVPLAGLKDVWERYISCPAASRFSFEAARESFTELIESMFLGEAVREGARAFFPSSLRNPIMEAGDGCRLLRLDYGGRSRLVEPYSLTFKVRKNGVGREYFYGFDQTGGQSSGPGIKAFVADKVDRVEVTDITFEPQWEFELRKSGGAETARRFTSRQRASSAGRARSTDYRFEVECPYCGRMFKRKRRNPKLNPHQDGYGNRCRGKLGQLRSI